MIKPSATEITQEVDLQKDLLGVLSSVKIGELDNDYAQSLIISGQITDLDQSVLEQIGEFYANSDPEATNLADAILDNLSLDTNIGLYFNNMEIASSGGLAWNDPSVNDVWTSRQLISGIGNEEGSAKGYVSRAFLSSEKNSDYFYFGGYVGDGNLTVYLGKNVLSARVEAMFSADFDVSVNNGPITSHSPPIGQPHNFTLSNGDFVLGDNHLYFTSDDYLYIAGGFVKVVYNETADLETLNKYYFPGVDGFINIYDSFYIPGFLNSMEAYLHFDSNYDIFFAIGNETLYVGNGTNEQVTLDNAFLSGALDYSSLTEKTVPFRLALENVSYALNATMNAEVFSVTDLSGSMDDDYDCTGVTCGLGECCGWFCLNCNSDEEQANCEACGGVPEGKIISAKEANKVFINAVLNDTNNRVGLIGYRSDFDPNAYHTLSNDNVSLINEVDTWSASGGTCICCGINYGVNRLDAQASPFNFRSLVIMSDGAATYYCDDFNDFTGSGTGSSSDPIDTESAIQAACNAYVNYSIRVYAVAFGDDADEDTLRAIADCGQGSFYSGEVDDLVEIYQEIAEEILNAAYYEQTIVGEGFSTILYPDSYISVGYSKTIPWGMTITAESEEAGINAPNINFTLPFDATPYEAKVISYSGSRWTSKVEIYDNNSATWDNVFDLSNYGNEYTELGDPFVVNLPLNKLSKGENSVKVSLGLKPINLTGGSQYNKVVYSVTKNISASSSILASAEGCNWTIEFEDETNFTMEIPYNYIGPNTCSYTSSEFVYNNNDAIDVAIFNLLSSLDLDSDGRVETKFTESDLTLMSTEVEGVPFVWETEAQVRVWR